MTHPHWPSRLAEAIAAEVRRHRKAQGLSAQQLADRCAELGYPIGRSVLANFESGRRPTISVAELLVLAKALGVAPVALLFPLGRVDSVEPLPDRPAPTRSGLGWFTGEGPLPNPGGNGVAPVDAADFHADRAGLTSYQWHKDYLNRWTETQKAAGRARTDAERDALRRGADSIEPRIYELRKRLRLLDLTLPELPRGLTHIDSADYQPPVLRGFLIDEDDDQIEGGS